VIFGGGEMVIQSVGTDPTGKLVIRVTGLEKPLDRSITILNEDPNLKLATGGLIPVQGPYVF